MCLVCSLRVTISFFFLPGNITIIQWLHVVSAYSHVVMDGREVMLLAFIGSQLSLLI